VTLLELKLPPLKDHASVSELAHQLVEFAPKFLSWLISFIIVCKFWLNHNHVLGLAHRADYGLAWLNSLFLMGQAFIPFPTAMMGEYPTNPVGGQRLRRGVTVNTLLFIAPASYLIGAVAAWLSVHAALVIYLLTPLFFVTPPEWHGKVQPAADEKK
jgi:hypothetical protein